MFGGRVFNRCSGLQWVPTRRLVPLFVLDKLLTGDLKNYKKRYMFITRPRWTSLRYIYAMVYITRSMKMAIFKSVFTDILALSYHRYNSMLILLQFC